MFHIDRNKKLSGTQICRGEVCDDVVLHTLTTPTKSYENIGCEAYKDFVVKEVQYIGPNWCTQTNKLDHSLGVL
jgi:hypothetical protein